MHPTIFYVWSMDNIIRIPKILLVKNNVMRVYPVIDFLISSKCSQAETTWLTGWIYDTLALPIWHLNTFPNLAPYHVIFNSLGTFRRGDICDEDTFNDMKWVYFTPFKLSRNLTDYFHRICEGLTNFIVIKNEFFKPNWKHTKFEFNQYNIGAIPLSHPPFLFHQCAQ